MTLVKICGIKDKTALDAAVQGGARFIGFVFYPDSPRAIDPSAADPLIRSLPYDQTEAVGLFGDPSDREIAIGCDAGITMIQLHGEESPRQVIEVQKRFKLPVMKAIRIATEADLERVDDYEGIADWLLFDAKREGVKGGTGRSFDWTILKDFHSRTPWMLAGGLDAGNVGAALSIISPQAVDVSSGVESASGVKDPVKIKEFMDAVRGSR
ncbi:MAG: phosphoribosylanthranilate isomerase [Alphaproteobacteria bacterium]|nr:phosphoribosylanthranilate isomerase [Alphaproteobacteria bacterium]